jgi:hypothetical protein
MDLLSQIAGGNREERFQESEIDGGIVAKQLVEGGAVSSDHSNYQETRFFQ